MSERCTSCDRLLSFMAHRVCQEKDKHVTPTLAMRVVDEIEWDLRDRRGIRHEWDNVDEDVQDEILTTLTAKVDAVLGASHE